MPTSQAMPGWRVFLGDREQSVVLHNSWTAGTANASIFGPHDTSMLEGSYSALLQAGIDPSGPNLPFLEASLVQTGLVPQDAVFLQFRMARFTGGLPQIGPFRVELDGQRIAVAPLFVHPNYTLFGGDVSAFAGTTADLRFIAETSQLPNNILLDSILFVPVPEPSTLALLSTGLICFAAYIRKRSRR